MNFISQQFIQYYKLFPLRTTFNILLSMTFPLDDFLIPYMTSKVIDNIQNHKSWVFHFIILIVILLMMQVIYTLGSRHDAILIPSLQNFIKNNMIADFLNKFEGSHKEPVIGEIMSRIIKIPLTFTYLYEQFKNYTIANLLSFIFTSIYIMTIDLKLGLFLLTCILIVFGIIIFSPVGCVNSTETQESSLTTMDEETEDIIRNINTVYINNQKEYELDRLKMYEKNYEKTYLNTINCTLKTRFITIFILCIMLCYILYKCYYGIKNKTISVGAFVAILLILTNWFSNLGWLISHIRDIVMNWGVINSYEKLLKEQIVIHEYYPEKAPEIPPEGVLFYKISFKSILNDINIYIPKYERLAIIGQIGSGKSTLLKLLLGLIKPSGGEIYINGQAISMMTPKQLRNKVTYVAQNPILFNRTIYENITYGLNDKPSMDMIYSLLYDLDLYDSLKDLNMSCGKNGNALSGGQKQIISILRAYLLNPEIIALDEITSSIDNNTKQKLFIMLEKLFIKKTIIIVTHDPDLMKLGTMKYVIGK